MFRIKLIYATTHTFSATATVASRDTAFLPSTSTTAPSILVATASVVAARQPRRCHGRRDRAGSNGRGEEEECSCTEGRSGTTSAVAARRSGRCHGRRDRADSEGRGEEEKEAPRTEEFSKATLVEAVHVPIVCSPSHGWSRHSAYNPCCIVSARAASERRRRAVRPYLSRLVAPIADGCVSPPPLEHSRPSSSYCVRRASCSCSYLCTSLDLAFRMPIYALN